MRPAAASEMRPAAASEMPASAAAMASTSAASASSGTRVSSAHQYSGQNSDGVDFELRHGNLERPPRATFIRAAYSNTR
jgi:hypothetical protein